MWRQIRDWGYANWKISDDFYLTAQFGVLSKTAFLLAVRFYESSSHLLSFLEDLSNSSYKTNDIITLVAMNYMPVK